MDEEKKGMGEESLESHESHVAESSSASESGSPPISPENAVKEAKVVSETEEETPSLTEAAPAVEGNETSEFKWYVVHTYSGYEQKAKVALKERIKQHHMEKNFADVLIPSESVIELVRGEKKTTSRKFFPGYMLVKMILNDSTWHLVKSTPKITGFVGNAISPPAVPEEEVLRITNQMQEGTLKPRPKVQFEEGESVRVIDGPFVNFNGVVEEVKPDKGKLRVMVSIFGRSTPVELEFVQVEKN